MKGFRLGTAVWLLVLATGLALGRGTMRWIFLASLPLLLGLGGCATQKGVETSTPPKDTGQTVPLYASRPDGVYKDGTPLPLYGVNWFGLETCDRAPHGLWSGRSVASFLAQIKGFGFNALRLPVGPEVLRDQGAVASWAQTGDPAYPTSPLAGLRYVLEKARGLGFYVLLDFHTFRCDLIGENLPGSPFDSSRGYTKDDWLADLRRLAGLSLEFPNVFGIDLANEPYNLTWEEWKALAQEGARAVLGVNPRVLVAVEGVGNLSLTGGTTPSGGELGGGPGRLGAGGPLALPTPRVRALGIRPALLLGPQLPKQHACDLGRPLRPPLGAGSPLGDRGVRWKVHRPGPDLAGCLRGLPKGQRGEGLVLLGPQPQLEGHGGAP